MRRRAYGWLSGAGGGGRGAGGGGVRDSVF